MTRYITVRFDVPDDEDEGRVPIAAFVQALDDTCNHIEPNFPSNVGFEIISDEGKGND